MASQLFWQWFNQSYNVGVNHANRNASNQMSNSQIMLAYGGATPSLTLSRATSAPPLPSIAHQPTLRDGACRCGGGLLLACRGAEPTGQEGPVALSGPPSHTLESIAALSSRCLFISTSYYSLLRIVRWYGSCPSPLAPRLSSLCRLLRWQRPVWSTCSSCDRTR